MSKTENKSNHLVFITSGFPYGESEPFIETEIEYLATHFEKTIIVTHDVDSTSFRDYPENVKIVRLDYNPRLIDKLLSFVGIFSSSFWKEINIIYRVYKQKINFGMIKTMIISKYNSRRLAKAYIEIGEQLENPIYYSYWCNDSALALAHLKLKNKSLKCISRIHRWDVYFEENHYNYLPYRHFIVNSLNVIYSISNDGILYVKEMWKIKDSNLKLSRLGIRKNMNCIPNESNDFILVSCSSMISVKRVKLIVKSLCLLNEYSVKWVHFGDGRLFNEIKNMAEELLSLSNIRFELKGRVNNQEIIEYYRAHKPSLFINVSSSEGVPVSIMEAFSCGIPCIATDVGGNSEIVNNINGYLLVANPSVNQISQSIDEYYQLTTEMKNKKKQSAYNTWRKHYDATQNYNSFADEILLL